MRSSERSLPSQSLFFVFALTLLFTAGIAVSQDPDPASANCPAAPLNAAPVCVTTYHNQNARLGLNYNEQVLTKSKLQTGLTSFTDSVGGQVYAQPLFLPQIKMSDGHLHNVVFVATETNDVYAWDGDVAQTSPYWHVSLLNANGTTRYQILAGGGSGNDIICDNISPYVGVTGTPAITITSSTSSEIDHATIFVVARTKSTNSVPAGAYYQTLYALDATSGSVIAWIDVSATLNGVSFNPLTQNQRPALLYQGGRVYIAWASHCDNGHQHAQTASWYGWVMSYQLTGGSFGSGPTGVWLTSSYPEAGIWQSGSGPAGDGTYVYFAIGNGSTTSAPYTTESPCTGCYGNSIVKLNGTPNVSGSFDVADYFTPYDHPFRFCKDYDTGSGGLVVLQNTGFTPSNLIVQSGKEGNIYVLNSATGSMGQYGGTQGAFSCPATPSGTDNILQMIPADLCSPTGQECGVRGSPVVWSKKAFFGPGCQAIKEYSLAQGSGGSGWLTLKAATTVGGGVNSACGSGNNNVFSYPGASLAASQYTGGAILWALDNGGYGQGVAPTLYAYDATNISAATVLFSAPAGTGGAVKFTIPTVVNGHVYVGNSNQLVVFH